MDAILLRTSAKRLCYCILDEYCWFQLFYKQAVWNQLFVFNIGHDFHFSNLLCQCHKMEIYSWNAAIAQSSFFFNRDRVRCQCNTPCTWRRFIKIGISKKVLQVRDYEFDYTAFFRKSPGSHGTLFPCHVVNSNLF